MIKTSFALRVFARPAKLKLQRSTLQGANKLYYKLNRGLTTDSELLKSNQRY